MDTRANSPAAAAQPPAPAATAKPDVLLSTGSLFHLPLPRIAHTARRAGFAGLELVMGSPAIAPGPAVFEAHALCPVRAVHAPFRNWSGWGGHKNAWRAAVALAAALSPPSRAEVGPLPVTLHPPGGSLRDAVQARWFARTVDLPRLLDAPPHVSLCLENLPWTPGGYFGRDPFAALLDECRERGLLLTLDACHLGVSGRDILADLARVPAGLLGHAHCSDAEGFAEHLAPGAGALPLGPFLERLGARGDVRTVSLELDPAQLPEEEDGQATALSRLREGMIRALDGCAPSAWAGPSCMSSCMSSGMSPGSSSGMSSGLWRGAGFTTLG